MFFIQLFIIVVLVRLLLKQV